MYKCSWRTSKVTFHHSVHHREVERKRTRNCQLVVITWKSMKCVNLQNQRTKKPILIFTIEISLLFAWCWLRKFDFLNLFSRDDTYLYFWVLAPAEDVYPKSFRLFFQKENSKRVRKEVGNISISCDIVMTDNFSYINFSRL